MSSNRRNATRSTISCPNEEGWVAEFEAAQKAVKKSKNSQGGTSAADVHLRLAVAARTLRQYKICQEACHSGLKLCAPAVGPTTREKFLECQTQANRELAVISHMDDDSYKKDILPDIWNHSLVIDYVLTPHEAYKHVNILQDCALNGDVRLLEHVVAMGAALDISPIESSHSATALVLVCATLALVTKAKRMMLVPLSTAIPSHVESGMVQCAVHLVMLGANVQAKFSQPSPENRNMNAALFAKMDLYGKTAYELALITKHKVLIKAIKELETKESRIAKCHCRCGSRLSWAECHGFPRTGESPYYMERKKESCRVLFRYSPLAPCHCGSANNKPHFACCWKETADPCYKDDADGELYGYQTMVVDRNNPMQTVFVESVRRRREMGATDDEALFPGLANMSADEARVGMANVLRMQGPAFFRHRILSNHGPKSAMLDWNLEVYIGTFERLGEDHFHWRDLHWQVDKVELLKRVDEWNTALAQYCDDVGLIGQKRAQVIQKHSANPCAPCANLSCTNFETKGKEFARCSRCKRVSYCSTTCQRQHWKEHKKKCITS